MAVRCFILHVSEKQVTRYKSASTLILGDSHPHCAICADNLDGSFNFAFPGEGLVPSYTALELFSGDSLNNIQLVVLGVSYHSFSHQDMFVDTAFDYKFLFSLYPLIRERIKQVHRERFPYRTVIEVTACYELGFLSRNSIPEIAHFLQENITSTAIGSTSIEWREREWKMRIDKHFYENSSHTLSPPSLASINVLQNIRELCHRKGYFLVLYNAPVSRDYYANIPPFYKCLMDSVVHSLVDNQTTFYIDHSQYPLPDNHFRDCDHVNIHGAKIVTPLLRDSLRSLGILPASHAL
jgi:hypothetical protein